MTMTVEVFSSIFLCLLLLLLTTEAATRHVLQKKVFLIISHYSQETVLETPARVFSCEYGKIFKNTYFEEHL